MTPSDIARQYASDVVSGGIVACRYVKLACQRFLNDLERQDDDDWPYVFDEAKADRAVKFMQLMPHTKGKWSASKSKLVFEPLAGIHRGQHLRLGQEGHRQAQVP